MHDPYIIVVKGFLSFGSLKVAGCLSIDMLMNASELLHFVKQQVELLPWEFGLDPGSDSVVETQIAQEHREEASDYADLGFFH